MNKKKNTKVKYATGGELTTSVDPPSKTTHKRIMESINTLASQGKSYDDIIKGIDDLLSLKDIQQEVESQYTGFGMGQEITPIQSFPESNINKNPEYQGGGELLAQAAPQLLNLALPGLGTAFSPVIGQALKSVQDSKVLKDHYNSISQGTNPYGNYAMGGTLGGDEKAPMYDGNTHAQGGIQVGPDGTPSPNAVGEVEDGEVKVKLKGKTNILSAKLKI